MPQQAQPEVAIRYGVRLGEVNILTPERMAAEFIVAAAIYPLPLAPRRIRGMTQRRGQPVVVFDAGTAAPEFLPTMMRRAVLVIDTDHEPAALFVDHPPAMVRCTPMASTPGRPLVPFADALIEACEQSDHEPPVVWWQVDFRRLFELLAHDR
jgi:chemotaxis signal transduction protein